MNFISFFEDFTIYSQTELVLYFYRNKWCKNKFACKSAETKRTGEKIDGSFRRGVAMRLAKLAGFDYGLKIFRLGKAEMTENIEKSGFLNLGECKLKKMQKFRKISQNFGKNRQKNRQRTGGVKWIN